MQRAKAVQIFDQDLKEAISDVKKCELGGRLRLYATQSHLASWRVVS